MFGYCSIGSDTSPIVPRSTKKMEITVESTGRLIKLVNVIVFFFYVLTIDGRRPKSSPRWHSLGLLLVALARHGVEEAL